jgi:SNF2 family DNA or RNA helicase
MLTGATKNRGDVVDQFQEDPNTSTIIIQIQTGGLGITLTSAATAIFYSMNFSYADYEQAKARIHRIGQTRSVNYIHLIAEGTVDEDILYAVQHKKDVATLVVDKLKGQGLL